MEIRVECDAGDRGEDEPRTFYLGARRIEIMVVLDRWPGSGHRYFKVQAYDGTRYLLRYDETSATWEMKWFTVSR